MSNLDAYNEWSFALDLVVRDGDYSQSCIKTLAQRPEPIRWLVAMRTIEAQVFNGGICAVYYNFCWEFLPFAVAGYKGIGHDRRAAILETVMSAVPRERFSGPSEFWPYEYPMPDMSEDELERLEQEWYAMNTIALDESKAKLVRAHPEVFANK